MSSGFLTVDLIGDRSVTARLSAMGPTVHAAMVSKVQFYTVKLHGRVTNDKLQGQVLRHITGKLSRSIQWRFEDTAEKVTGTVYSDGSVKYAGIHEFGGVIHHPGGTKYFIDKASGMARFISNKSEAAAWAYPTTRPHDIPIPKRSFLRSSLKDLAVEISLGLKTAALKAAKAKSQ